MSKYLKNPFNYIGGKYKLLPQLLDIFPQNINTFIDLFCGGGDVFLNVNANTIIANDIVKPLYDLNQFLLKESWEEILKYLKDTIKQFILSKDEYDAKENYLIFRDYYNTKSKNPLDFYILICYSFSNQIRFSKDGVFNMPSGKGRSYFNSSLEKKLKEYHTYINNHNITFLSKSFENISIDTLGENDFIYIDPPYYLSDAPYNTNTWNKEKELKLLEYIDNINNKGIKFALSNLIETKGKQHTDLINFVKKNNFNMKEIKSDYKNCNYHRKNSEDIEVVITNY